MTQKFTQQTKELEEFLELIEEDLENIQRVKKFCQTNNLDVEYIIHGKAETVEESSQNTGINPEEIIKTLIFKTRDNYLAVLCPGDTSVNEEKLEDQLGNKVEMANPEEVTENTGYTIGGISPFDLDIQTLIDEEILEQDKVKPAAGSRVVGVKINPKKLKQAIDAEVVDVSR